MNRQSKLYSPSLMAFYLLLFDLSLHVCFSLTFTFFLIYFSLSFFPPLVRVMKLKNNILYPVEGNLVTTILPDDKLILKCLFPNPKKIEQIEKIEM